MSLGGGSERHTAKGMNESPANHNEQLMEEVCERENCWAGLQASEVQQGKCGHRRHDGGGVARTLEGALASHSGTTAERDLQAAAGEASRDTEAGRRDASVGHPDSAGAHGAAGGNAGSATQKGRGVFRTQSRFGPGRSAHQAVAKAQKYVAEGKRWVVDLDLEKFLETASYCPLVDESDSNSSGC